MIKISSYVSVALILFGVLNFEAIEYTLEEVKPKIKSIKEVRYFVGPNDKVLDRQIALTSFKYKIEEFNEQGKVIRQDNYNKSGHLRHRNVYAYNEKGDQTSLNIMSSTTGINSYGKSVYVYDAHDKIKVKHHETGNQYTPKKSVSKTKFYYKGDLLVKKVTDELWMKKKSVIIEEFEYNDLDKLVILTEYRDKDYLFKKSSYTYNDEGYLISSQFSTYPKGGNPAYIREFRKYDENENVIESFIETAKPYHSRQVYQYNEANLKTSYQKYEKDELIIDEYFEYTYDRYGNWITMVKKFPSSENKWITEREISYFSN